MAFPVGVETRTIRMQVPLDILGNEPKVYAGTVRPDRTLIWAATGDRLWPAGARVDGIEAGYVNFEVPIVDQGGWLDKDGAPVLDWTYRLHMVATWAVDKRAVVRNFQVFEATADPIDLELLPEGESMPPVDPGDPYVVSLAGFSGAITAAQLKRESIGQGWRPESFGDRAPGFPNNDTPAMLQAIAAAAVWGGPVELQGGKTYGVTGDLLVKNGVSIRGGGANAYGNGNSTRLKALDDTFRFRWGSASAGGANFPAEVRDIVVDGDNIAGAGHELFRIEAVDSTLDNVVVLNSAGDGMVLHNAQNCTLINPRVDNCPNGTAYKIQNNDEATYLGEPFNGQAGGHNVVIGGHFTRSLRLFHMDYDVVNEAQALNFWPHDNLFFGTIFEQYQDDVELLGRISDGETRFNNCTFTGSSGMLTVDEDCLILVENAKRPALPTYVTFDSCDFGGGALGVSDIIRSKSYGAAVAVRIYGRTSVANANRGYFLCDDRGPDGGLGVLGGVNGPVDGLMASDAALATLGAAGPTNDIPVTVGYADLTVGQKVHVIDLETGAYIAEGRTITAKLVGPDRVTLSGAPITTTAGDYFLTIGVRMSRGLNGGSGGSYVTQLRQPTRYIMDRFQGRPFQTRRLGDAANRFSIDRDGGMRWEDGAGGLTGSAIPVSGGGMLYSGQNVIEVAKFTNLTQPAASNPFYIGRIIINTDLGVMLWSNGVDWKPVADPVAGGTAQPVDSDLTAIAALATTSYGRALLTLANQAALVGLLPSYQPLDGDLSNIAALATVIYGRSLLTLSSANQLTAEILAASESQSGRLEIATQSETNAGLDDERAITALKLAVRLAAYAQPKDSDLDAIAALATTTYGRALLTLADQAALMGQLAIATELVAGIAKVATQTQTNTGADDTAIVTPLKLKTRMTAYAQPLDSDLTAIAALTTTTFGRALLTLADSAALAAAIAPATTSAQGAVELATDAEAIAGTDATRALTPSNLPAVRAGLGHIERKADNTQTITSGGAAQVVLWQTSEVTGRGGISYAAGVFTLATAGTYAVTVYAGMAASSAGRRQLILRHTKAADASVNTRGALVTPAPAAGQWLASAAATVDAAAGDSIDVTVFQDSGAGLLLSSGYITIHRVA